MNAPNKNDDRHAHRLVPDAPVPAWADRGCGNLRRQYVFTTFFTRHGSLSLLLAIPGLYSKHEQNTA